MKWVLIGQQGNGTNLFRDLVNCHPDIYFFDEIFLNKKRNYEVFNSATENHKTFLDRKLNEKNIEHVGFDLKYNQFEAPIIEYIQKEKLHVIHMKRDPARTFWKTNNKTQFLKTDVESYCKVVRKNEEKTKSLFENNDYTELRYEWLTGGEKIINNLRGDVHNWLIELFGVQDKVEFITKRDDIRF